MMPEPFVICVGDIQYKIYLTYREFDKMKGGDEREKKKVFQHIYNRICEFRAKQKANFQVPESESMVMVQTDKAGYQNTQMSQDSMVISQSNYGEEVEIKTNAFSQDNKKKAPVKRKPSATYSASSSSMLTSFSTSQEVSDSMITSTGNSQASNSQASLFSQNTQEETSEQLYQKYLKRKQQEQRKNVFFDNEINCTREAAAAAATMPPPSKVTSNPKRSSPAPSPTSTHPTLKKLLIKPNPEHSYSQSVPSDEDSEAMTISDDDTLEDLTPVQPQGKAAQRGSKRKLGKQLLPGQATMEKYVNMGKAQIQGKQFYPYNHKCKCLFEI